MLANLILVLHAAFVFFVVGGLAAIWIGFALGRRWCTNPWFRGLHLAAIGFVVVESLLGYACSLTIWEDTLRSSGAEARFVQRWVSAILYWNAPGWVFTVLYVPFGAVVVWAEPAQPERTPSNVR